jgi:hypothetical protein
MSDPALKLTVPRRAATPAPVAAVPALVVLAAAAVLLTGCGNGTDLTRSFGLTRDAPDEFTVTTQQPLSMPPDYSLRPPSPGAPRPQQLSEERQAQEALVPQTALTGAPTGQASSGQAALVQAAGPTAPSNIRAEVNDEAAAAAQQSKSFVDSLLFWRPTPPPGIVVDPQKEAQRIRENAALGRSQDSGDTPIIQPAKKGWLEGLF